MELIFNSDKELATKFQENETMDSIAQNIQLILSTKKGTLPFYRDFGLPMEFIDKPIDLAQTIATLEISEALDEFEPRAVLKSLNFEPTADGKTAIRLEVEIKNG